MILAAIILFVVTLILDLWTDYNLFLSGKDVKHKRGGWLRAPTLGTAIALFSWQHPWWLWIVSGFMVFFVFVALFDGAWNTLRKDAFFKTHDKGVFDKFWHSLGWLPSMLIKTCGIVLTVALYIKWH